MEEILKGIADNQALTQALREVFNKHFSLEDIGTTYDNETLGQLVRARVDGQKKVEEAFREIEKYKTPPKDAPSSLNPGR